MDPIHSELLGRVIETYHRALADSLEARSRLETKGISSDLADRFRVGWATGMLGSMARGDVLGRLKRLGLLDAQGRDRFQEQIVIPAVDGQGSVVQLAAYAADGSLSWLFPEETPVFWNADALKKAPMVVLLPDPWSALERIAKGEDAVIAPAGPGSPLGALAKEQLLAHAPRVELRDCEGLRAEIEKLGIPVGGGPRELKEFELLQDENGLTAQAPRGLTFVLQGLHQDSPRHLRASVKLFRKPREGGGGTDRPRIHLDTFDLYHARSRNGFARTAACLLGEDPTLLEDYLGRLVGVAEEHLRARREGAPEGAVISPSEREEALGLLRDPRYPERVAEDLSQLGYVGEEENKLVAYLASLSRKLEDPLSVLVVSRSAAGKSTLSEAIAMLAPPEEVLRFTRLTAQTLYYQRPDSLRHRMVVIEEEKGVEDAAYALRALQSSKHLTLSTAAGKGDARKREVKGPVSLFVTTTRTDLDEETAGRFLTVSVDESKEQTRAILSAQRAAEARSPARREQVLGLHQNAQRLLSPVKVVNPFAPRLTFPDDRLSARRDHRKYLGLIRAVAFSRQHQREVREGILEVTLEDIALANRLAHHALGHSLYDLTPPSRRLLFELRDWLAERAAKGGMAMGEARFTRRELREHTGWKRTQLEEHLKELVQAEYVLAVSGEQQGRRAQYRLDWDGQGLGGDRFYPGLVDLRELAGDLPGACRPGSGKQEGAGKGQKGPRKRTFSKTCRLAGEEGSR